MDQTTGRKTIGERHIYTNQILKMLEDVNEGQTLRYKEMTAAIGLDTQPGGDGYSYQRSARRIMEREFNAVFEALTNVGLKRLPPTDVAKSSTNSFLSPLRRHIARQKRRLNTLNDEYENLDDESRFGVDTARTIIAFTDSMTRKKAVKKIAEKVTSSNKMIGFRDTLALFNGNK